MSQMYWLLWGCGGDWIVPCDPGLCCVAAAWLRPAVMGLLPCWQAQVFLGSARICSCSVLWRSLGDIFHLASTSTRMAFPSNSIACLQCQLCCSCGPRAGCTRIDKYLPERCVMQLRLASWRQVQYAWPACPYARDD